MVEVETHPVAHYRLGLKKAQGSRLVEVPVYVCSEDSGFAGLGSQFAREVPKSFNSLKLQIGMTGEVRRL